MIVLSDDFVCWYWVSLQVWTAARAFCKCCSGETRDQNIILQKGGESKRESSLYSPGSHSETRGWSSDPALENLLPQPPTLKESLLLVPVAARRLRTRPACCCCMGGVETERCVKTPQRNQPTGVSDERTGKQRKGDAAGIVLLLHLMSYTNELAGINNRTHIFTSDDCDDTSSSWLLGKLFWSASLCLWIGFRSWHWTFLLWNTRNRFGPAGAARIRSSCDGVAWAVLCQLRGRLFGGAEMDWGEWKHFKTVSSPMFRHEKK